MNKSLLLLLCAGASLFLSGCVEGAYYSGSTRGYSRGSAYGGHGYSPGYGGSYYGSGYSDYDSEPIFIRRDYVYINDQPYYVPIYRHHNETYYTYNGQRYSYSRSGRDYDNTSSQSHSGYVSREKLKDSERHRREEQQRYQDRLRKERERYEDKTHASREKAKDTDHRRQLEEEFRRKEYEARLRDAKKKSKDGH